MKKFKSSAFVFAFAGITLLSTNAQAALPEEIEFVNSEECFSTIQLLFQEETQEQTWSTVAPYFKRITGRQKICDRDGGFTVLVLFRAIQSYAQDELIHLSNEMSMAALGWTPWYFRSPLYMPGDPPLKPKESPLKEDETQKPKDEWEAKKQFRITVMEQWIAETEQSWDRVPVMQKWEPQLLQWTRNRKPLMQKWIAETEQRWEPNVTKWAAEQMREWVALTQSWAKEMKNRELQRQKWESQMREWENVLNETKMKDWSLIKNSLLASLSVFSQKVQMYNRYGEELSKKLRDIIEELKSLKEGDLPQYSIFSKLGTIIELYLVEFEGLPKVQLQYSVSPKYPTPIPIRQYGITELYFTIPAYGPFTIQPSYEGNFKTLFKSFENECDKFLNPHAKNSD